MNHHTMTYGGRQHVRDKGVFTLIGGGAFLFLNTAIILKHIKEE
jgi:hypothetical protein